MGGGNLLQYVPCKRIIANNIDIYTISLLQKIQKDGVTWLPKNRTEFTDREYKKVRENKSKYKPYIIGYVGYAISFGGKWFGGYPKGNSNRDYIREAYDHLNKQYNLLKDKDIEWHVGDYKNVNIPNNSIIYCDPPYKGTTKYKSGFFNYEEFYNYCINKSSNNEVYISEYDMPKPFKEIWNKEVKCTLRNDSNNEIRVEKLFTIK